ncbi:ABC transporter ATP-binding protein [Chloroflexota bacterium]
MSLIETRELGQRFGERDILKNINLRVERGEVFALIGPTGTGKTTFLRLINLLDPPTSGRIYFDGTDITESGKGRVETRRRMAFVLQKPVVFNMSVYDNIAYGLKWRGQAKSDIHRKVDDMLNVIGLAGYQNRNARTLSGGEVQRVAIARAIISQPEVLLMDEPTANLDPVSASRIEDLIADIIRRDTITIIMATHDMAQGQRLADRVGVLLDGEIQQTGDWHEVFNSPRNKEVANFIGMENIIDGVVMSNEDGIATVEVSGHKIEVISDHQAGTGVSVCVRPEDVTVSASKISSSARNSFTGEITRTVSMGPLASIKIDCGFSLVSLVTKRSAAELNLVKKEHVYATFKATAAHVIKR